MVDSFEETMSFKVQTDEEIEIKDIMKQVHESLQEKGYNPINQIVGYLLSGDPAYITSYNNARTLIRKIERDELLEELVKNYLEGI
ncbi:MAG: IreB family regulatory phosphoprotein [Candidatus Syntrophonatronum acetioxidans]|uniref:UPF0297 protein D5R97_01735 n=1 Tax=Candidatus Syntrophonatronum acetioxidans TaxID=1795816 RepID=A0A424YHS2_9FIRM|nr:MAG: IreB family regulatory phosphoprotein [Candidatus Syntrophonatronum acetioxidans]